MDKKRPGAVRDAIFSVLTARPGGASIAEIEHGVACLIGGTPSSSIRSYLRLNTPQQFSRTGRAHYALQSQPALAPPSQADQASEAAQAVQSSPGLPPTPPPDFQFGKAELVLSDCMDWLAARPARSLHAVVTDPPYGLFEYSEEQKSKLRSGKGGVWRVPPSFDGSKRAPLPRFTVLTPKDIAHLEDFFHRWACALKRVLVPGANVVVASNPLLSYAVSSALSRAGLERRGEIVRQVMTMRGGDRPKDAHEEFSGISVMPRSMWEPWLVYRSPLEGRVQDNLRKWGTGGFRRPSEDKPFGDVIQSAPTHANERKLAPHPSLKPQAFMRQIARAALPLGEGIILDPFAGSGSTLAAAEAVGYASVGVEKDLEFFDLARAAIPKLAALKIG